MTPFDGFDEVPVPDQWDDIVQRSASATDPVEVGAVSDGRGARRGRSNWVLMGAAVSVLVLVAGFFAIDSSRTSTREASEATGDIVMTPTSDASAATTETTTEPTTPSTSAVEESSSAAVPCATEADLSEIGELLRSGQPVYDYQPARDVAQLVEWADLVIAGDLVSTQRTESPNGAGLTAFEISDVQVLAGEGDVDLIVSQAEWAQGQGLDPLGERVMFDGLRFIAFLVTHTAAPDGWTPLVDGMAFGCDGLSTPAGEVGPNPIVPLVDLPPGVLGMSVDEIAVEVQRLAGAPSQPSITRPVIRSTECERISAQEFTGSGPIESVFLSRDEVFPIQIVAAPEATAADPFALIQRWDEVTDEGMRGEVSVINGVDVAIGTFENGNGEATWLLSDESVGYLRSRGFDRTAIEAVVGSLQARPLDAALPGFDVDTSQTRFAIRHEQLNTDPVETFRATSECLFGDDGWLYRVSALGGDVIWQHIAIIDRGPPPGEVQIVGGTVVVLDGTDSFSIDDVVQSDFGEWAQLLDQPDFATQITTPPDVPIVVGSRDDVELELFDATGTELESGPLLLRLTEEYNAATGDRTGVFLEIDASQITLHPDADVMVTFIDGRIRGRGTARVGPVSGSRRSDGETPAPFEISVRIVDGDPEDLDGDGDRPLQLSPTIRLVPREP